MTRRLSALRPSFLPFLKIHFPLLGLGFFPSSRKYLCPPLFLGALVAGRAQTGLPGRWQGSPLPGLSLPISTVSQAHRSRLPLPLHLVACYSQPVPGAGVGVSAWTLGCGPAAVPSLSRLIWPQQGRRQLVTGPSGAGRQMGSETAPPVSPSAPPPCAPAALRLRTLSGAEAAPRPAPGRTRRAFAGNLTPQRVPALPQFLPSPLPREYVGARRRRSQTPASTSDPAYGARISREGFNSGARPGASSSRSKCQGHLLRP